MDTPETQLANDGSAIWAGMGDYILVSPNGAHRVELIYESEPPHGDSYHRGVFDGHPFPGHLWGCMFAFSPCSRYFVFSWMSKLFERLTVVADLQAQRYFVMPAYLYDFDVCWPSIVGKGKLSSDKQFLFRGNEQWLSY